MDEKKVREILGNTIHHNNKLGSYGYYINWSPEKERIDLEGEFTADELEAFAWWMKNTKGV